MAEQIMKRQSVSKRIRFSVFTRDGFACRYCGKTAPDVQLEVDHLVPVALGGGNARDNLVTSCHDCNRGKAARSLDDVIPPLSPDVVLESARTAKAQADALVEEQRAMKEREEALRVVAYPLYVRLQEIVAPGEEWTAEMDYLCDKTWKAVCQFVERLPLEKVAEAVEAVERKEEWSGFGGSAALRYFCGACWRMVREAAAQ